MGAILGIVGFVLALFVVGALMERNLRKAGLFGAALLGCGILIMSIDGNRGRHYPASKNCWTEWDLRTSRTVCD